MKITPRQLTTSTELRLLIDISRYSVIRPFGMLEGCHETVAFLGKISVMTGAEIPRGASWKVRYTYPSSKLLV